MFVVFDMDGTLSDLSHRLHHIQGRSKDWRRFFAESGGDAPIEAGLKMLRILAESDAVDRLEIWTGRSREAELQTLEWLRAHTDLDVDQLTVRMRPEGDRRRDTALKKGWLDDLRASGELLPDLVFEDRAAVVAMWRAEGIACFQVAEGDF